MLELLTLKNGIAFVTLTLLEIVLGIDNIVLIAILSAKLPEERRAAARRIGLLLALIMRVGLLVALAWIMGLTKPLFTIGEHGFSGRDLIMLGGGGFLIAKATFEIHEHLEEHSREELSKRAYASFGAVIAQIALLDMVFSLDSVITAVGMAESIWVMIAAVVAAIGFMLVAAGTISGFIEHHPTVKMLALAFMLMVGVVLVAESLHTHIPRGYIYSAMGFSLVVELLNLWRHANRKAGDAKRLQAEDGAGGTARRGGH